jgi:hypothetical protein
MAQRASMLITGPKGTARARQHDAVDALRGRDAEKMRAAERDPNTDTSRENVNRAKRESWSAGASSDQHTPKQ